MRVRARTSAGASAGVQRPARERRCAGAVERHVHPEVLRHFRQIGRGQAHEVRLGHRPQCVVRAALLADRRGRLLRDVPPAQRPRAVRRVDAHRVGQREQLVVERVVEHRGHLLRGVAGRSREVGAAHVSDEERVPGQHQLRLAARLVVDHQHRHALGRVPGGLQEAQRDLADPDLVAVAHAAMRERCTRPGPDHDRRPGALGQLAVAAHEVGVEVRLHDVLDREALRLRLVEVLVDVAPRVDDRGLAVRADHVRRLGQAAEVELLEIHGYPRVSRIRAVTKRARGVNA